jgi:hypothetical protein
VQVDVWELIRKGVEKNELGTLANHVSPFNANLIRDVR